MLYPLKFKPILKTVVWGGEKIAPYKGLVTSQHNIGESWELSGVQGNESIVSEGELAGQSITELISKYGAELMGKSYKGTDFPLLIKFIDANDNLSIQVHPDDELAAQRHNSRGKTEMWYVVEAEPGAYLYSGFSQEITPEEYVERIADDSITSVLARHDVNEGDIFFLPAGRVHAICGGCFIAEIQQTSDITYRIYDYNRPGLDGKPRQLHTELAKDAIDYKVYPDYRTAANVVENVENEVVSCDYFTTSLFSIDKPLTKDLSAIDSFLVVMCVRGEGQLACDGVSVSLNQGETVLVPACSQSVTFVPSDDSVLKLVTSRL